MALILEMAWSDDGKLNFRVAKKSGNLEKLGIWQFRLKNPEKPLNWEILKKNPGKS